MLVRQLATFHHHDFGATSVNAVYAAGLQNLGQHFGVVSMVARTSIVRGQMQIHIFKSFNSLRIEE